MEESKLQIIICKSLVLIYETVGKCWERIKIEKGRGLWMSPKESEI
jgi:hypothetical protein